MAIRQTPEQKRANNAWNNVNSMSGQSSGVRKAYASQARSLPATIQTNGLGQTLAFMSAKGAGKTETARAYRSLYAHLSGWVYMRLNTGANQTRDLLNWIIQTDSADYRRATNEALAYALWLRRFAEAKGWGDEAPPGAGTNENGGSAEGENNGQAATATP